MELQFEKDPCRCLQRRVCQVQEQEQTQEVRLNDGMPDIGSVVGVWGQCILRTKEWHTDRICVSGGVMANVLYLSEDTDQLQAISCWLPVNLRWDMPDSEKEGAIHTGWLLKSVDARMLSSRKLMVRASVQAHTQALEPRQIELFRPTQLPEDVQLFSKRYPVNLAVEAGEKSFAVADEMSIGPEPPVETVIGVQAYPVVSECSVVGGKVVFRGNVQLRMIYLGEDGMVHSAEQAVSFSQFADLDQDYDKNATAVVLCAVTNLETEVEAGKVGVKAGVVAQYLIYEQKMMEIVEDAYSPVRSVKYQTATVDMNIELDRRIQTETVGIKTDWKPARIVETAVYPQYSTIRRNADVALLDHVGSIRMLYYDDNGTLRCESQRYELTKEYPASENTRLIMLTQPELLSARVAEGEDGAALEASVTSSLICEANNGLDCVASLELGEKQSPDPSRPSLILRRSDGSSLWKLAKEAGSTMAAIREANGFSDEPDDGRMLLIPVQ